MTDNQQLLAAYVKNGSEPAFRELVTRYVNLVYSSALRLVNGDSHLAEDVTQTVFADLAQMAKKLSPDTTLGGWLHRHTYFVATNTMRGERRRQNRERQALEMNSAEDHSEANLAVIAPVLDEAINELGSEDREAIVLRFFEQKDFRAVGAALGSNEDAARKRVSRALDKLHSLLTNRGVVLSVTGLTATLTTHAVHAAPAGLALSVSSAALATAAVATAAGGGATVTFLKIMSMTKLQVGVAAVVVAALAIPLAMEHQSNSKLREENATLKKEVAQIAQLSSENQRLAALVADANKAAKVAASTNEQTHEVMKLRGEVGRLQTEVNAPKPSALSKVISDPEMRKMMRKQQKMGMSMIYGDLAKKLKLSDDQKEKFSDMMADDIMESVDHVGDLLRDGKSYEEIDQTFTQQEAAFRDKVKELLGDDGLTQYKDYTRDLTPHFVAEQIKGDLSGDKKAKDEKSKQLFELMRDETQAALTEAGLPSDFQTFLILNFRNIASETEAEKNIKFMDSIYERTAAKAASFLDEKELKKFAEFRTNAAQGNRMMLTMNRKLMAPANK